jgi:protein arginine kinase
MHNSHLGYITTDPKNLGTALKLSVRINLPKLSKDSRVSTVLKFLNLSQNFRIIDEDKKTDESSILEIAATPTLGRSEVEVAQSFVDSIHKLIEIEKTLQNDGSLDELLY